MDEAIAIVQKLLWDAQDWRELHKKTGRKIEAAGAQIRIRAMRDVLNALSTPHHPPGSEP